MKLKKFLIVLTTIGWAHEQLYAEAIFDAAAYCPATQFGLLYGCAKLPEEKQVNLKPDQVTDSQIPFLKNTPIINKINYKFDCQASRQFNVGLTLDSQSFAFFWNQAGQIEASYKLSEQDAKTYSLIFQPPSTSTPIRPGCVVNIISNVSYPDADVLGEFANFLELAVTDLVSLQGDVDLSVELPAKWAVLKASPARINAVITDLTIELSGYQGELGELRNDTSGTIEVAERKETLQTLIGSYSADVEILELLIKDINDVASVDTQCESTTLDAYCVQTVTGLTDRLNKVIDEKIKVVEKFNSFIDSEVNRLRSISLTASNVLKKKKVSITAR